MPPRKQPDVLVGALTGAILTPPLVAFFYVGWKLIGLPFVPFNLFDWISRRLPGPLITIGIDSMVRLIRALPLGATATAAKTAEQTMAIVGFLALGMTAGALLFVVLRVWKKRPYSAVLGLGAVAGVMTLLIIRSLDHAPAVNAAFDGAWILSGFLLWGPAFGWAHERLRTISSASGDIVNRVEVERVDRRRFIIRLGSATAVMTVVGAGVGVLVGSRRTGGATERGLEAAPVPLPNADALLRPAPGTRPELTPLESHYRIDIDTLPPKVDEESWRLMIGGLVDRPLELTLEDIRRYEPMDQFITLSCISNPIAGDLIGTARWTGVGLKRLLPDLGLKSNATHLKISALDGFYETIALETIDSDERVMLAYAWDGVPLLTEHGFPLRIYIPDRYGMKQPKWIVSIDATDAWEGGYWVVRGWDRDAHMKATAVIDTVAVDMMIGQATNDTLVPVGGIAHAGARGISKVEVQVDGGEWREAQLRAPLSGLTWVVWRYDWPFQQGKHTLTVRCVDGNGHPQIVEEAPPHPSGASGLHTKSTML
jgi:DMSO/TMAO reductase YedYZ molybdopterin-dependent catalytic subunit